MAKKQANDWGLYDMAGNLLEWCHDWYQEDLGYSGVLLHYDGSKWMEDPTWPGSATLYSIWGTGSEVWVVGYGGAIWRRREGRWGVMTSGTATPL